MIKNAIVYSVEMPTLEAMREFAREFTVEKPLAHETKTIGFSPLNVSKNIVTDFPGGYCINVRTWEKKIDSAALKAEVERRLETLDRPSSKKERDEMKDAVLINMLPHILPSPKDVQAYYHEHTKTLIVDTSSPKVADEVTCLLRKAVGSLKATTLYVDARIGFTKTFADVIGGIEAQFLGSKYIIADSVELKNDESTVRFKDVDLFDSTTADEIVGQIQDSGMYVKSVGMVDHSEHGDITFNIVDGSRFTGFKFSINGDGNGEDDWQAEAWFSVLYITEVAKTLVDRFTVVEDGDA